LSSAIKSGTLDNMLHAAHIRAARALLGWHQDELAKRSKVGLATVQRLERSPPGPVMAHVSTIIKISDCLKSAGIEFLYGDGNDGLGARLTRPRK
jgi:transcriptional regulator with XRE-family HTH domain